MDFNSISALADAAVTQCLGEPVSLRLASGQTFEGVSAIIEEGVEKYGDVGQMIGTETLISFQKSIVNNQKPAEVLYKNTWLKLGMPRSEDQSMVTYAVGKA